MRNQIDLGSYSFMNGQIGSLQTLAVVPVIAGDSLTLNMQSIIRLSPLRKALSVDAQCDSFAFFVPHRHIYSNWVQFIKDGVDGSEVLEAVTIAAGADLHYLGIKMTALQAYPLWCIAGYNQIYNRYFRFLKLTPEVPDNWALDTAYPPTHTAANSPILRGADTWLYGYPCARLKTPWSTGIPSPLEATGEQTLAIPVSGTANLDIVDLIKTKMRYKSELEKDFFAIRYDDIMKGKWGTGVNVDADQRPTLIMRKTHSLSGYDVDGTADANLGTYAGKSLSNTNLSFKRKHFNEHGTLWILQLVRFPTICHNEINPLIHNASPNYDEIAGDYEIELTKPPIVTDSEDWFAEPQGQIDIGNIPHGQHYRWQHNTIHKGYRDITGFPFLKPNSLFTNHLKHIYCKPTDYAEIFSNVQLGHWQSQSAIHLMAHRKYPSAAQSIFAGTK